MWHGMCMMEMCIFRSCNNGRCCCCCRGMLIALLCLVAIPTLTGRCGVQLQHVLANCRSRLASPASACSRMCVPSVSRTKRATYVYVSRHACGKRSSCVFECELLLDYATPNRVQYKLTLSDCKLCRVTAMNSKQQQLQFKCSYLKCFLLLL